LLSKRSIRREFIAQLVIALAVLIAIFSLILYGYIKNEILSDKKYELLLDIKQLSSDIKSNSKNSFLSILDSKSKSIKYLEFEKESKSFMKILYPYKNQTLEYKTEITHTKRLISKIFNAILIINFVSLVVVVIYAFIVSEIMLKPIFFLSKRVTKLNKNLIDKIDLNSLPVEFVPLGKSLNSFIGRMRLFTKYQKELFIGTAHELNTPLTVIKSKSQLALKKEQDAEKYREIIETNIDSVDYMSSMIKSILQIGREELAQLENSQYLDIIDLINKKAQTLLIISKKDIRNLVFDIDERPFFTHLQPTLFIHILKNLVDNAIKFSKKDTDVTVRIYRLCEKRLKIEVINEGSINNEKLDFFAPFARDGENAGFGLGLFLAKSASDAIGTKISLKNDNKKSLVIASFELVNSKKTK